MTVPGHYSRFAEAAAGRGQGAERLRVLVAEDDRTTREMLVNRLTGWNYDVVAVDDGVPALAHLCSENPPHIAVLDWLMPELDGLEVCRRVRQGQTEDDRYIYLIFLTIKGSQSDVVMGLEAGADDYLVKPFDPGELKARLLAGRRTIELDQQLRLANQQLLEKSRLDPLTGLNNRRTLFQLFGREIARSERIDQPLSLGLVDIDHFKSINDRFGHQVGDQVLRECAERLASILEQYHVVGRYGGEEFMFISPRTDTVKAQHLAERLRLAISLRPITWSGQSVIVTVSIGLATWDRTESADELVERADRALYEAKAQGRNRVCLG